MWSAPKTDWHGETVNGKYTGDRFNAKDYNRIKNNLYHLWKMAIDRYEYFEIAPLGDDKTPTDYFYADEINRFEQTLDAINDHTVNGVYGMAQTYVDNGSTPDYKELNRLESAMLDLYTKFSKWSVAKRMFKFNFGIKEGF